VTRVFSVVHFLTTTLTIYHSNIGVADYEHKARKSAHHIVGPRRRLQVLLKEEAEGELTKWFVYMLVFIYLWSFDIDGKLVIRRRKVATQTPIETCEVYLILITNPSLNITQTMSYVHGPNGRFGNKDSGCRNPTTSC
jgi:hypothetical protein